MEYVSSLLGRKREQGQHDADEPTTAEATAKRLKVSPPAASLQHLASVVSISSSDGSRTQTPSPVAVDSMAASDSDESVVQESSASTPKPSLQQESSSNASPRRSGRERKSTTIMINGHVVKKQNNYSVVGMSYVYHGDGVAQQQQTKKQQQPKSKAPVPEKQPTRKKVNQAEQDRLKRLADIKARVSNKADARKSFLSSHVKQLEPFVDQKVADSLNKFGSQKKKASVASKDVFMQPDLVQADMRDYQLQGLEWMVRMHKSNLSMILGDEMGLGKTLQTISLLCYLKETEQYSGPSLVICPLSVLYSWCNEITKWAPSLKFLRLHSSSSDERESQKMSLQEKFATFDVVITTYEMAKSPSLQSFWRRQFFNYLILDEGHIIRNRETHIAEAVRKLHYENTMILTGTPLQNDLVELYSLLNFLYPEVFTTPQPFADAFCIRGKQVIDKEKLQLAHELLGLFMLRRLKEQVEKLLPEKLETKVICPLSETQRFWYKGLLLKDIDSIVNASEKVDNSITVSSTSYQKLNNLMMQLRKCCGHPFLFDGAELDMDSTTCLDLVAASGKLAVLDMLLRTLYQKGHRVVLFSQFTSVLDILEDYCNMRGWNYCRFDGSTPRARRNWTVKRFNDPESEDFVFLMSTRSGGMGLNLQTADTCILFDSDYNPQPDIQAMARVHRIGQQKKVHVYRLVTGGTIEEKIVEHAQKKLYLDQMVNRGAADATDSKENSSLSASELLATLKFGCNAVFGDANDGQNALPTAKDIEIITDRSRTEDFSSGNLKGGVTQKAADFDTSAKESYATGTATFGGVDFKALRDARDKKYKTVAGLAEEWAGLNKGKRERKSRIVMLDGNKSGYGSAAVPVLASNNYDLEAGESSVFARELAGRHHYNPAASKKSKTRQFSEQDVCQICGDGGDLLVCPSCPVCVHQDCVQARRPQDFYSCPHHRCTMCLKNFTNSGGILFPCQACPTSYCEDCMPDDIHRVLGECERFEELGFDSTKKHCYIHCSPRCEAYAEKEFGWKPKSKKKAPCPAPMDVSFAFGKPNDNTEEKPAAASAGLRASPRFAGKGKATPPAKKMTTPASRRSSPRVLDVYSPESHL